MLLGYRGFSKVSRHGSYLPLSFVSHIKQRTTALSAYDWIKITEPKDYAQLVQILDPVFRPQSVSDQLQRAITNQVGVVLIEHDYVDKDYRSTFYNFYAKMGRFYRDDCVRLHFFDATVVFDEEWTDITCPDDRPEDHYFGYVVLRPTVPRTLGRSILSPDIRVGACGRAIQSRHYTHLLGHKLPVWGFPSMAQHADIAVCAHVACWAILRHYSERFSQHREFLVHDVTKLATPFDPGGLTPSFGLDIVKAERIFQAAGCFPVVVRKRKQEGHFDWGFYSQLLAYLESGFPLFVAMHGRQHAIVVAGYAWDIHPNPPLPAKPHVWSQVSSLLAVDDNFFPYKNVAPGSPNSSSDLSQPYTAQDFDTFIVPLPEKIYYPADAIEKLSEDFFQLFQNVFKVPDGDRLVKNYFVTTISALRRYAKEHRSELGEVLVGLIMHLDTAQFIWVVEYASEVQWAQGHIVTRMIVDASASCKDLTPFWLAHNGELALVFDRTSAGNDREPGIVGLKRSTSTQLGRMKQNLRPIFKV